MGRLSVNVNKIATLRNARGGDVPNLVKVALDCEKFGAQGITVHPRPDERHIRYRDVYDLKEALATEFNIEGYPSERFIDLVLDVKPTQVTLVPDPPDALTSNSGWDVIQNTSLLKEVIARFKEEGIRVSIFMNCDLTQIEAAKFVGTDRIELYTGPYAEEYKENPEGAIAPYISAAKKADEIGLGINAGHDLDLNNLKFFKEQINGLLEVSIGHALISDTLYMGLEATIENYLKALSWSHEDM